MSNFTIPLRTVCLGTKWFVTELCPQTTVSCGYLTRFYDQTSGYFFEINPAGAMGDAQLVPAQGGGSFGTTENRAWDGIWMARVTRHNQGWTAEIEIPFRTLNFDPQAQAWGANFQRTVRRKNEESFWTGWGLNQGLFSLPAAGRIEGIDEVTQGRGLDIKPYMIGTYTDSPGREIGSTYQGDAGLDVFYNLTPQLKANFTLNTDFAQTEVDDRQGESHSLPGFLSGEARFLSRRCGQLRFFARSAAQLECVLLTTHRPHRRRTTPENRLRWEADRERRQF